MNYFLRRCYILLSIIFVSMPAVDVTQQDSSRSESISSSAQTTASTGTPTGSTQATAKDTGSQDDLSSTAKSGAEHSSRPDRGDFDVMVEVKEKTETGISEDNSVKVAVIREHLKQLGLLDDAKAVAVTSEKNTYKFSKTIPEGVLLVGSGAKVALPAPTVKFLLMHKLATVVSPEPCAAVQAVPGTITVVYNLGPLVYRTGTVLLTAFGGYIWSCITGQRALTFQERHDFERALLRFEQEQGVRFSVEDLERIGACQGFDCYKMFTPQEVFDMRQEGSVMPVLTVDENGKPYFDGQFVFESAYRNGSKIDTLVAPHEFQRLKDAEINQSAVANALIYYNASPERRQEAFVRAEKRLESEFGQKFLLRNIDLPIKYVKYMNQVYSPEELVRMRSSGVGDIPILTLDQNGDPYIDGEWTLGFDLNEFQRIQGIYYLPPKIECHKLRNFGLKEINSIKHKAQQQKHQNKIVAGGGGLNPKDPKDEEEHPNGKYEDAKYHHKNSRGPKSQGPRDGQKALDNSLPIEPGSADRVAIEGDGFVVLRETLKGIYHGYVVSWTNLHIDVQNALIKHGLTNARGKILKK